MTAELSIRFTVADEKAEDSPLSVSLFRPDTGVSTNPAPFTPPLDDAVLKEIRWYLLVIESARTRCSSSLANIASRAVFWPIIGGLQLILIQRWRNSHTSRPPARRC